jgi:hypothetical protein
MAGEHQETYEVSPSEMLELTVPDLREILASTGEPELLVAAIYLLRNRSGFEAQDTARLSSLLTPGRDERALIQVLAALQKIQQGFPQKRRGGERKRGMVRDPRNRRTVLTKRRIWRSS